MSFVDLLLRRPLKSSEEKRQKVGPTRTTPGASLRVAVIFAP
jgi:hypothetical protein